MSTSRAELVYAKIITEYQAIKVVDGYRTTPSIVKLIRDSKHMPSLSATTPEVGIECGQTEIEIEGWTTDDSGNLSVVVNEYIPYYVVGTTKADTDLGGDGTNLKAALDALLHDLKRVTVKLYTKYINQTTDELKWNIVTSDEKPRVKFDEALGLGENRNIALCGTMFTVKIRNEDSTFTG